MRCGSQSLKRSDLHTFKVLPRRWVVDRAFGWLRRYRRLSRDYERQAKTGETMIYLAVIRLMLTRLGRGFKQALRWICLDEWFRWGARLYLAGSSILMCKLRN
jgi:hypothetical protein